jgi:hypothetical protein
MEERGTLARAGALLLAGIGTAKVSAALLDGLTLLTLGPQLRGGANVRKGTAGIRTVFNVIQEIAQASVVKLEEMRIEIKNATGRIVLIELVAAINRSTSSPMRCLRSLPSPAFRVLRRLVIVSKVSLR